MRFRRKQIQARMTRIEKPQSETPEERKVISLIVLILRPWRPFSKSKGRFT